MASKLIKSLKLAAHWLNVEGIEAVSANEENDQIEVYVNRKLKTDSMCIPDFYKGFEVKIKWLN